MLQVSTGHSADYGLQKVPVAELLASPFSHVPPGALPCIILPCHIWDVSCDLGSLGEMHFSDFTVFHLALLSTDSTPSHPVP